MATTSAMDYKTCALPDGAVLAYQVLKPQATTPSESSSPDAPISAAARADAVPLVLICGMASARGDWVRLSTEFATSRPVLIYDHRGIGDSKHPPELALGEDKFTIETLARDLAFLINHLGWEEVAILGFSMGGVVLQQLLVLPYLQTNPLSLPFRVTHAILASTRCEVLRDPRYGLQTLPEPKSDAAGAAAAKPPSMAERYDNVRRTIESTVDPTWMKTNGGQRLDFMIQRVLSGSPRSLHTISRQKKALQLFDFVDLLVHIPQTLPVLVLHGEADQIIPFQCSQEICRRIHSATFVEVGPEPGKVPTLEFGHNFTLYFPAKVWGDMVRVFLSAPTPSAPSAGIEGDE